MELHVVSVGDSPPATEDRPSLFTGSLDETVKLCESCGVYRLVIGVAMAMPRQSLMKLLRLIISQKKKKKTLEAHVRLGIEKGRSELTVRGTLAPPHSFKKVQEMPL
ncbi:hypothetical protein Bca52824_038029 [Brassica carinata]|uniref:Uncharacterized protein n=1 Tax=Brassica carinata TaxID=52824 RepID=A0A8X7UTB9_BRACI|nr:hypothetical protein Bca52824_038029 [Brassica carinata]